jgi:hypothetical protein
LELWSKSTAKFAEAKFAEAERRQSDGSKGDLRMPISARDLRRNAFWMRLGADCDANCQTCNNTIVGHYLSNSLHLHALHVTLVMQIMHVNVNASEWPNIEELQIRPKVEECINMN